MLTSLLLQLDSLLASAVVIVTFSLLAYIALQNWHTAIARALCVLLAGIVIVFGGDVLLGQAQSETTIQFLLRAQWLGIVCIPAGYVHLSDALLTYSAVADRRRRWLVLASYLISAIFFFLAIQGNLLLSTSFRRGTIIQFAAGPLFWAFACYFILTSIGGLASVVYVRRLALTPTLRRRLTYLSATFLGPGMAVFPYLVIAGTYSFISNDVILMLSVFGNLCVAAMIIIMAYSIAFQGLFLPDRLIKQDFLRWGLYGPFVGLTLILFLRVVPVLADHLALPSETLLIFGIMISTVLMPLLVSKVRPYLDTLIYFQDREEIDYLRTLPRNTFTLADLRSLLENTLVVVCGTLRVETGFVAAPNEHGQFTIKSLVGSRRLVKRFVAEKPLNDIVQQLNTGTVKPLPSNEGQATIPFVQSEGFLLFPLKDPEGAFLGILGVMHPDSELNADNHRLIGALAHQMELALATVQMQQRLFDTLRGMGPEMRSLQELNSLLEQATPTSLETLESEVALLPDFPQFVKDALTHYWGGPKLSDSPLLGLRTVRKLLDEQESSPTRALQAVLRRAIENMRPDEQLDPSAQEWMLYNILQLRFLQGKRVRDIAERLALSESDLYRKQRIAVEEVARQLALMEEVESR